MRRIRLGRTDTEVSSISVGTWGHGGARSVGGRPVGWSGHDDRQAAAALRRAYELGLNHWDTADVYGNGQAESLIGALWGDIPRDDIFLASKVGMGPRSLPPLLRPTADPPAAGEVALPAPHRSDRSLLFSPL